MAKATHRLPLPASDGDLSITLATCPFTIITQARRAAFNIVKLKLVSQGVKVAYVERSVITAAANEYLRDHPELIEQAAEAIRSYPPLRKLAEQEAKERSRKAIKEAKLLALH